MSKTGGAETAAGSHSTQGGAYPWQVQLLTLVIGSGATAAVVKLVETDLLATMGLFLTFLLVSGILVPLGNRLSPKLVDAIEAWLGHTWGNVVSRFRRRYYRLLSFDVRNLDMKGLRTKVAWALELEQMFVPLSVAAESQPHLVKDLLRSVRSESHLWQIWDLIVRPERQFQCLVLIGPPGCGKTTLLRYVALVLARGRQRQAARSCPPLVPIFLQLRQHAEEIATRAPSLSELVRSHVRNRYELQPPPNWPARALARGRCLILLDGLDEVADPAQRRQVSAWVDKQMKCHHSNRFIASSRPQGFASAPLECATVLVVQPFAHQDVERFVNNWYLTTERLSHAKDDEGVRRAARDQAQDLLVRLRANAELSRLAVNPLLLTMIATVHQYRGALPGKRVELYREICEVLLGAWRTHRGIKSALGADKQRAVLQPLAFYMMQHQKREIGVREACDVIREPLKLVGSTLEPQSFLRNTAAESGLVVEREADVYAYAHLTFQEFLTACECKERQAEAELATYVHDSWWHETIRLYVAQASATAIVEACLDHDPPEPALLALAYDCLLEGRDLEPLVRQRLQEASIDALESNEPKRFRQATEVLIVRRLRKLVRVSDELAVDASYVTNAEFQLFLQDCHPDFAAAFRPGHWKSEAFPPNTALEPIRGISVRAAKSFCDWASARILGSLRLPSSDEARQVQPTLRPEDVADMLRATLPESDAVAAWCLGGALDTWCGESMSTATVFEQRLREDVASACRRAEVGRICAVPSLLLELYERPLMDQELRFPADRRSLPAVVESRDFELRLDLERALTLAQTWHPSSGLQKLFNPLRPIDTNGGEIAPLTPTSEDDLATILTKARGYERGGQSGKHFDLLLGVAGLMSQELALTAGATETQDAAGCVQQVLLARVMTQQRYGSGPASLLLPTLALTQSADPGVRDWAREKLDTLLTSLIKPNGAEPDPILFDVWTTVIAERLSEQRELPPLGGIRLARVTRGEG